jgi:hypothetical protein
MVPPDQRLGTAFRGKAAEGHRETPPGRKCLGAAAAQAVPRYRAACSLASISPRIAGSSIVGGTV